MASFSIYEDGDTDVGDVVDDCNNNRAKVSVTGVVNALETSHLIFKSISFFITFHSSMRF